MGYFKNLARGALTASQVAFQALRGKAVRNYDAADLSRFGANWNPTSSAANAVVAMNGPTLTRRARDMVRNNPYAARVVDLMAGNLVGAGVTTRWPDKRRRDAWKTWTEKTACDAENVSNYLGLLVLAIAATVESGEVLLRFRNTQPTAANPVGLRLQVLESDHLDWQKTGIFDNVMVMQGVEVDAEGQPVAYWLFPQHPGGSWPLLPSIAFQSVRVPASEVIHVFRKRRPGQVRGVTWLAPIITRLKDHSDYEASLLMKARIEACLALVVLGEGDDAVTGPAADLLRDAHGKAIEQFEPGMVAYRKNPGSMEVINPSGGGSHLGLAKRSLEASAAGVGLTYDQLTGDLSGANYSSLRAGKGEFRRLCEQLQYGMLIPMLVSRVAERFHRQGALLGLWNYDGEDPTHVPPAFEMVDPLKDAMALVTQVRAGFITPQEAAGMFGNDYAETIELYKKANALLDDAGVTLDTDTRRVAKSGSAHDPAQLAAIEIAATGAALPQTPPATDQPQGTSNAPG